MKIGSYQTLDPRRSRKGKFYWKIDKRHKSCKEECAAALSQCSKLEFKKISSKKFDAKKSQSNRIYSNHLPRLLCIYN